MQALIKGSRFDKIDRFAYWFASILLLLFVSFRPWGLGLDDVGGLDNRMINGVRPLVEGGDLVQGNRDYIWYSLISVLSSFMSLTNAALVLAGLGFTLKTFVIYNAAHHKCLALLLYISIFYIVYDVVALRSSLAMGIYLLGLYFLIDGKMLIGAGIILVNGMFHQQAWLAPLVFMGYYWPNNMTAGRVFILTPMVLLLIGFYPNRDVINSALEYPSLEPFLNIITHGYLKPQMNGELPSARSWPLVMPPTILLAAWLLSDVDNKQLNKYVSVSLFLSSTFLWLYGFISIIQFRLSTFFLAPLALIVGNTKATLAKVIVILLLVWVYLAKYVILHPVIGAEWRVRAAFDGSDVLALLIVSEKYNINSSSVTLEIFPTTGGVVEKIDDGEQCVGYCSWTIKQGANVLLGAYPEEGYRFIGWIGDCHEVRGKCLVKYKQHGNLRVFAKFQRI